jgi:hypothetical protein
MLFLQLIILNLFVNFNFAFKGNFNRKLIQIIENPKDYPTEDVFNATFPNDLILNDFHNAIHQMQFEGFWINGTRNNTFLETNSGAIKMQVGIYNITKNGREVQIKFTIQDGEYRNSWYIIEQSYVYFFNNDQDSDYKYNITDNEIVLNDKNVTYRQSTIKALHLFNYYLRYGKI